MKKARRSSKLDQRRVFRPRRRFPYGPVLRQLTVVVLMLAAAAGIAVLLHQLPQQVDIMLLLSEAIADLIRGVQQLLEAMLGLAAIVLIAAMALLTGVLLLGALWRLIRIIRLVISPPPSGSALTRSQGALMIPQLLQGHGSITITIQGFEVATDPGDTSGFASIQATVAITVGLAEMVLEAWPTGGSPLGT